MTQAGESSAGKQRRESSSRRESPRNPFPHFSPSSLAPDMHTPHRYLCEYIFNKSLAIDPRRTVFIHVPEDSKFPVNETADALAMVVRLLLQVVACSDDGDHSSPAQQQTSLPSLES